MVLGRPQPVLRSPLPSSRSHFSHISNHILYASLFYLHKFLTSIPHWPKVYYTHLGSNQQGIPEYKPKASCLKPPDLWSDTSAKNIFYFLVPDNLNNVFVRIIELSFFIHCKTFQFIAICKWPCLLYARALVTSCLLVFQ